MGLFNFAKPSDNASSGDQPVQLVVNSETIEVSAAEAKGKTVGDLFRQFASSICDVNRINRFVAAGTIVAASDDVKLGTVYTGAIASEAKG